MNDPTTLSFDDKQEGLCRNCENSVRHALQHFSAGAYEDDNFHHRKWALLSVAQPLKRTETSFCVSSTLRIPRTVTSFRSELGFAPPTSHDHATITGVALLVCLVTGIAIYIPARRAASVEPTTALRE